MKTVTNANFYLQPWSSVVCFGVTINPKFVNTAQVGVDRSDGPRTCRSV